MCAVHALTTAISSHRVVYAGVLRSCFIDRALRLPIFMSPRMAAWQRAVPSSVDLRVGSTRYQYYWASCFLNGLERMKHDTWP